LTHGRFVGVHRIDALCDRKRTLKDGMDGVGMIAICRRKIGLQLRLQVGGVKQRQHLSCVHAVAFAHVNGIRRLRETALDGNVLVRRDDAGQPPGRFHAAIGRNRRLHVRRLGSLRGRAPPAAGCD
jgi:hypothetical protein